jgi:hypothetical protein
VLVKEGIEELILILIVWQPVINRSGSIGTSRSSEIPSWPIASSSVNNGTSTSLTAASSPAPMWEEIVRVPQIMTTATTHFPDSAPSLLDHALQLVSRDSAGGWIGRLVEDSGPGRAMQLEVEIPLSDGEGERILGLFLGDCPLSSDWEVGSHDGNGSS